MDSAAEIEELTARFDIPVELHESRGRRFDGVSTVTTILMIGAGGMGAGVLSAVGTDFWSGVKSLVGRLRREPDSECVVTIIYVDGGREVHLICEITGPPDIDRLVAALRDSVPGRGEPEGTTYRLDDTGVWKRLEG